VVAVAALGGGCTADSGATVPSSSVPADDIDLCTEVYEAGMTVTEADIGVACKTEDGELRSPVPIRIQCEDDRVLLWNDIGWGFVGDPLTITPEDQVSKMPTDALEECLAGTSSGPTTTVG
jgi:hypothetical protein